MSTLYKITADYRHNNPNPPDYYVRAPSSREAKRRFMAIFSWLDIYNVEICTENDALKIMASPEKHIII